MPPSSCGIIGTRPPIISGMLGTAMMASPTTVTNISPTSTAVIFSKVAYLPNQTMTKPARPIRMAQAHSGSTGNTAANGSAAEDIAVAP